MRPCRALIQWRTVDLLEKTAHWPSDDPSHIAGAWAAYTCYNTALILIASLVTYVAPMAVTSGLPPLKAFLNGVNVPGLLEFRTLVAKIIGTILVVSTGLPLGKEGPMVHTGAIVAARVTRFKVIVPQAAFLMRLGTAGLRVHANFVTRRR